MVVILLTCICLPLHKLSDPDALLDPLERTPRRRDPPTWLKENPDYEVEGDMLEVCTFMTLISCQFMLLWFQVYKGRQVCTLFLFYNITCLVP